MAVHLSPGKWQRLRSLTDEQGRFKMLAIDQRGSLQAAIGRATGKKPGEVGREDMVAAKAVITRILAPYATAVLTDPEYGFPQTLPELPPRVGLLLAHEQSGYERAGADGRERQSALLEGWSVEKTQRSGADAAKLLIYYHPDASEPVRRHQQGLVARLGEQCAALEMPFLLELVTYPLGGASADSAEFARQRPDLVIRSAQEFGKPEYGVDILKLEFPADLKWTREFCNGAFDGKERQAVYSLSQVRQHCRDLDSAAGMPWVILSAGVGIEEFLVQVDLATEAGASGFLCGRAIWQDAVPFYPDVAAMEQWLCTRGAYNFLRANAHAHLAVPWPRHRRFGQPQEPVLSGARHPGR